MIGHASLLTLDAVPTYLKISFVALALAMAVTGGVLLALQGCRAELWLKSKIKLSLALHLALLLLLIVSLQPYAAVFVLLLLAVKTLVLLHCR